MGINEIKNTDCLSGLKQLSDNSIDCCVTSPPYWGLRDYGHSGQLGLEKTPEEYVAKMVEIFTEVNRVLKSEGTLWLNLGDSYANNGSGGYGKTGGRDKSTLQSKMPPIGTMVTDKKVPLGLKAKDLVGIPWMVAFALRSSGWYLRQDIIWAKPNPMPESVTDRCTKSHEYIFLMSKSSRYYYDNEAIKQPMKESSYSRLSQDVDSQEGSEVPGKTNGNMKAKGRVIGNLIGGGVANKRSVWTVTTKPFKEAHFATFPEDLIVDCIKAGCPEGGLVLDPFMGAGTTALVAFKNNRNYIGFELNEQYIKMAENRIKNATKVQMQLF